MLSSTDLATLSSMKLIKKERLFGSDRKQICKNGGIMRTSKRETKSRQKDKHSKMKKLKQKRANQMG